VGEEIIAYLVSHGFPMLESLASTEMLCARLAQGLLAYPEFERPREAASVHLCLLRRVASGLPRRPLSGPEARYHRIDRKLAVVFLVEESFPGREVMPRWSRNKPVRSVSGDESFGA
jgi:hypothetical protein